MENVEMDFNQKYALRSKLFAVNIIHFYSNNCKKNEELRVIGKQLLRSGTSVAVILGHTREHALKPNALPKYVLW